MKINRNKDRKGFRIKYLIVTGFILTLLFFTNVSNSLKKYVEDLFLPIQGTIYQKKEEIAGNVRTYLNRDKLQKENEMLRQENQKLAFVLQENIGLVEENKRLTSLLEMKANLPRDIKFAKVYFRKPENMYDQFYIDMGKDNGIQRNMIVVQGENLIGRVVEVYKKEALVYMITKEGVAVSAKTENHMFGVVKGIGEGTIYFEPNVYDDSLKVGDKIYTSGISDVYPGDIYIGYIVEIIKGDDSLFTSIVVKPSINVSSLKEVLLMPKRRNDEN